MSNEFQIRQAWQRRVTALREVQAPAGTPERTHYAAGVDAGRIWAAELLATAPAGLQTALFGMGFIEGVMTELNADIDRQN